MNRRLLRLSVAGGLVLGLVVGTSASGVASTSRPAFAAVATSDTTVPKKPVRVGSGVQVDAPKTEQETRGLEALALISFPWRETLPGWRIRFLPARKGYLALTYRVERRIDVFVRPGRSTVALAHDIAHELGHAVDVSYLDDDARARYLEIRRLNESTPWWACDGCTDLQTGAGDFAESFALLVAPKYRFYSRLGNEPSEAQLERVTDEVLNPTLETA
jgi:hypothetical protein